MSAQSDGKFKIIIYGDDSAATEEEHEGMSEMDIEAKGGVDCCRFWTLDEATRVGIDLSYLDDGTSAPGPRM